MKKKFVRRFVYLVLSLFVPLMLLGWISQLDVQAANYVVTTTQDNVAGSLRQAIQDANQNPDPDTITFDLPPQSTIILKFDFLDYLMISDTLTIDGGTAVSLTIKGNYYDLFTIAPGTAVTITDLTLTKGVETGRAIHNDGGQVTVLRTSFIENLRGEGGAVYNDGGLMLIQDSRFLDNESADGNGILNDGELEVINTLFRNNRGYGGDNGEGGGISNCTGATLTITNSRFINNSNASGGAINNCGTFCAPDCDGGISPGIVNISDSVFSGNYAEWGGVLFNSGIMNIENSTIHNNEAEYMGGGILNDGILNIVTSTITSNTANTYGGGGIGQTIKAVLTVSHSLIGNNTAVNGGGGILIESGSALIEDSAIVSNTATFGGGVNVRMHSPPHAPHVTIKNSTLSGNLAVGSDADGGGGAMKVISPTSNITITQSTLANNAAPNQTGRDGIWQVQGSVLIQQSLVAENGTENCTQDGGFWEGSTYNLADDASCAGFMEGDPLLAPLGDYGGNTLTHSLLLGSPAVDAGDNALCLARDQRGELRPIDGNGDGTAVCDIGAVEMNFWPWQNYLPIILR